MRAALAILLFAACGRNADKQLPAIESVGSDERCNPAESHVCVGADVVACEPTGTLGRRLRSCHDGCKHGACTPNCSTAGVELIYLVDVDNNFLSFDPRKLPGDPFHLIGRLNCGRGPGRPFSMSIDRGGVAWVVYGSGEIFKVSISDARCEPSAYVAGSGGLQTFGMGFVTDTPGGKTEKLFVAANDDSRELASIDTDQARPAPRMVGTLATNGQNPELTGTSEARLFGFYPDPDGPSYIQEIDRNTAAAKGQRWTLGTTSLGFLSAYAFAQWGGVFYVFATSEDSAVHTVNRTTGEYKTILEHVPYRISGAGVSTCAPELDRSAGSATRPP